MRQRSVLEDKSEQLEKVVCCPVCIESRYEVVYTMQVKFGPVASILLCVRCGLLFLDQRFSADYAQTFYGEDDYREKLDQNNEQKILQKVWNPERLLGEHRVLHFCGDIFGKDIKLLEVGAGAGGTLAYIEEKTGCKGIGIEPSAALVEFGKYRGIELVRGDLESASLAPHSFDVCLLIHVLEHLYDPFLALKKIHDILRPGGYLYLIVPDFVDRLRILPLYDGVTIYHPYMFCNESLRYILEHTGFSVIKIQDDFHPWKDWKGLPIPHTHIQVLAKANIAQKFFIPNIEDIKHQIKINQWRSVWFDITSFSFHLWMRVAGRVIRQLFGYGLYGFLNNFRKKIISK